MKHNKRILPISDLRAHVTDGSVHLQWHANEDFFKIAAVTQDEECAHVRIWRKAVDGPDECFAPPYAFPYGIEGAECVHEGFVNCTDATYRWSDTPPCPTCVVQNYVYFIATKHMAPLELLPLAVRHPEMWWSVDELQRRLQAVADAYPQQVTLGVCGQTAAGRPIPVLTAGTGTPALGLVGLVHAGESGPELMLPVVERLLHDEPELMARVRIILIPGVNLDNRETMARGYPYYLRTNAAGVDINRNFPGFWDEVSCGHGERTDQVGSPTYRGGSAACAPETQAVMRALDDPELKAVFSCHWGSSLCAFPALSCVQCKDDAAYVNDSRRVVELYSAGLYPERAYEEWFHGLQTTSGSLGAWLYLTRRIPAFDLEGGSIQLGYGTADHSPFDLVMLEEYRTRHFRAIREVLREYVCTGVSATAR